MCLQWVIYMHICVFYDFEEERGLMVAEEHYKRKCILERDLSEGGDYARFALLTHEFSHRVDAWNHGSTTKRAAI